MTESQGPRAKNSTDCPQCNGKGWLTVGDQQVQCHTCSGTYLIDRKGGVRINVSGMNAKEVASVARQLAADATARKQIVKLRSPWFSGLFYLTVVVVIVMMLLVVGRVLALWALPLVILGAVFLVSVVGALQMRQDDQLSERGFLRLMADVFRRLPLLTSRGRAPEE